MEIFNYLHLTTRRLIAVILVAVLAGVATAFVLGDDGADSYEAEVVVFLGQALPPDRSTFAVAPFAGDLEVLLSLDPVQQQVADASGIDAIAIDGLSTQQLANGTAVSIRATAQTPEMAETVATEAARVGLRTLLEQERDRARRSLDSAEIQLLEARADLEQFRGNNDTQDPSVEYRIAVDELTSLQVQLLNTGLTAEGRTALEDRQAELRTEIERLSPLQSPYNELDRAAVGTETAVNQAKQELSETEALLAGAASGDFEVSTPADVATSRGTLLAGVAASMIVVVLLAIGLFALIDGRKRKRNPERQLAIASGQPTQGETPSTPAEQSAETPVSDDGVEVAASPATIERDDAQPKETEQDETQQDETEQDENGEEVDTPVEATAAGPSANGSADPDLVCVCGRVCRTAGGLSSHQRACDDYNRSLVEAPVADVTDAVDPTDTVDADASGGPAGSDHDSGLEASTSRSIWILMPDSATSERWESDRPRMLEQLFEHDGLDEDDPLTIVDAHGDAYDQIGQAEQAIAEEAAVIVLIDSEPESVAMIIELADEAGVRVVVEQTEPSTDGADPEHAGDEGDNDHEDDHDAEHDRADGGDGEVDNDDEVDDEVDDDERSFVVALRDGVEPPGSRWTPVRPNRG